jgi:hypothetical protein
MIGIKHLCLTAAQPRVAQPHRQTLYEPPRIYLADGDIRDRCGAGRVGVDTPRDKSGPSQPRRGDIRQCSRDASSLGRCSDYVGCGRLGSSRSASRARDL